MNRLFIISLLFTISLFARYEASPAQACPAYNNLKHTKNTHDVYLDTSRQYTIIESGHKGQTLILIKGENPAQRWVDDACFEAQKSDAKQSNAKTTDTETPINTKKYDNNAQPDNVSKDNLLVLSWHNAFCQTHPYKKECKRSFGSLLRSRYEERHFVLHGLWPQPKNRIYCNVSDTLKELDRRGEWRGLPEPLQNDELKKALEEIMPGVDSYLHRHEWIKHGTCYGKDADGYFSDAVGLVKQVNDSEVGKFFEANIGKSVTLAQVKNVFNRAFGMGAGNHLQMQCKGGLITELWLYAGSGSDDLSTLFQRGKRAFTRCERGRIDQAGL